MSIEVTDQLSDHAIFFVDEGRRKKTFFSRTKKYRFYKVVLSAFITFVIYQQH
jgi:hypothetical protein